MEASTGEIPIKKIVGITIFNRFSGSDEGYKRVECVGDEKKLDKLIRYGYIYIL